MTCSMVKTVTKVSSTHMHCRWRDTQLPLATSDCLRCLAAPASRLADAVACQWWQPTFLMS